MSTNSRPQYGRSVAWWSVLLTALLWAWSSCVVAADPFADFDLPDAWESQFWAKADVKALFSLSPREVADLVPVQAGIRFCRCPACEAPEADNPLTWSVTKPKLLTCRRCGETVPSAKFLAKKASGEKKDDKPAEKCDEPKEDNEKKDDGKAEKVDEKPKSDEKPKAEPEDTVEVRPGVFHKYPYHEVEPEHQRYPGERLYLEAKRDDLAREFLAKAALYAAVRSREQPEGRKDPALARTAAVILLRFAQVYPNYATHYDQPESPKYFDRADLRPPYRRGYQTAKWDWTGSQDVPLNLVVAYALLRGHPAIVQTGELLDEPEPVRVIERDLFRASAEFVRNQPEEPTEASLQVDRGLLAVGRLLDDPALVREALGRLNRFTERGFYHDGFWRQGTLSAHRRVLGQFDGWIGRLLSGYPDSPMIALAHQAGSAVLAAPPSAEIQLASWPDRPSFNPRRTPMLLGGAGVARLAVGQEADALDVELRGLDSLGPDRIERQALRLAIGGNTVLDDLDEGPGLPSGFDRASVSRNTVVVDGLNQRESLSKAREPAAGGNFLFFAADPDFQVVTLDDPRSYPQSATRYRQTLIASAGSRTRYAIGIFEVAGGLQHDQLFHTPAGSSARWRLSVPTTPGPTTLLAAGLTTVPLTRAEDDRWFVQAYSEFAPITQGSITRPAQAWLASPAAGADATPSGIRLHVLTDAPLRAITAASPDPLDLPRQGTHGDSGRGSLILRHLSEKGATLRTTFVTVFEPVSTAIPPLTRVGRMPAKGAVVVYLETPDGPEHIVVNFKPGTSVTVNLVDGRVLKTDGLAVRVSATGLVLAGGTFAECAGQTVRLEPFTGEINWAVRQTSTGSRGFFESSVPLPAPESLVGRVLLIRHGDGTTRGWTLQRVENVADRARLHVREEPGFLIDPSSRAAVYYQFPRTTCSGPHSFRISRIAR